MTVLDVGVAPTEDEADADDLAAGLAVLAKHLVWNGIDCSEHPDNDEVEAIIVAEIVSHSLLLEQFVPKLSRSRMERSMSRI